MTEPAKTLTARIMTLSLAGLAPAAIAERTGGNRKTISGIVARLRRRGDLPPPAAIPAETLGGRIMALVSIAAPAGVTPGELMEDLDCSASDYRRAIASLLARGAIVFAAGGQLHLPGSKAPLASRLSPAPAERRRRLLDAIVRRAFAIAFDGDTQAAVALLNESARRAHDEPARTNFLVLGDLIGASQGLYRDVDPGAPIREALAAAGVP